MAVVTEGESVRRMLSHLGLPTQAPPVARARSPSEEVDDEEATGQLELALG
jgi:hypothetical protein